MATSARKHVVPAAGETPRRQVINDLAGSINDVVPVANTTERAQLVADVVAAGHTWPRPLLVARADATPGFELEVTVEGTKWRPVSGGTLSRYITPTAAGSLGAGVYVSIGPTQTTPAAPFGPGVPYRVTQRASMGVVLAPGGAARMEVHRDGTQYAATYTENRGSANTLVTVRIADDAYITDDSAHTWDVRLQAVGVGAIVQADNARQWYIDATPRGVL